MPTVRLTGYHFSPREAGIALLRHRAGDGLEGTPLRPYSSGHTALPCSVDGSSFLEDVLPEAERTPYEGLLTDCMLPLADQEPAPKPYVDVVLDKNKDKYKEFVQLLFKKGLVEWRRKRRCDVGLFCRKEKYRAPHDY